MGWKKLLHKFFQSHPTLNWLLWLLCKLLLCIWHYNVLQLAEICEKWSYLIFLLFLELQIVGSSKNIDTCWNFLGRVYLHQMFLFLHLFLHMMLGWSWTLVCMLQSCELFVFFTCSSLCFDCRVTSFSFLFLLNALKLRNINSLKLCT
jgi:hypothetical protein